ncbi:MAG: ROK family protein [Ginsengibacter sp.]
MDEKYLIGIDLGGTNVRAAIVQNGTISRNSSIRINGSGSVDEVLADLYRLTDSLINSSITAIGIGVPSVVDVKKGIVYDVQNIPSWKEVDLKKRMENRYHLPVLINNDANCFALGEKYFGKGRQVHSMVGLAIGTGLGAGIIINDKLYCGANCGAGEFGEVAYLEHNYEYYASGQFFKNLYKKTGEEVFQKAQSGDKTAIDMFHEFGTHMGNAIKMILYTYDPELIILGGSIRHAYSFYQQIMWERIHTFSYPKSLLNLHIEISELEACGVLGAAALYYDSQPFQ